MAIISALIGGIFGFLSGLAALLVFQTSFMTALTWYLYVGISTTILLIALPLAYGIAVNFIKRHDKLANHRIQVIDSNARARAGTL